MALAERIRRDPRLNGTAGELAALARRAEAAILRSAIARASLRIVNDRLARKVDDEEAQDGKGGHQVPGR